MSALMVDRHLAFLRALMDLDASAGSKKMSSFEYESMLHLKMSALYWALTATILLGNGDRLSLSSPSNMAILKFLRGCWRPRVGGFAGNTNAHDAHILFTLSALQILCILRWRGLEAEEAEFLASWFDPKAISQYVMSLQREDGSFAGDEFGEIDTRFTYCAVACIHLLGSKVDTHLRKDAFRSARKFLRKCRNFDGGFGAVPGAESHGGNVFCCVAALYLMDKADDADAKASEQNASMDDERLLEWLVWRQVAGNEGCGLNGRPEKSPDVCYSWWILSAMRLLIQTKEQRPQQLPIDQDALLAFILAAQDPIQGGISDRPGDRGDIFHTLFGVAGLAFLNYPGVAAVDESLCLPVCCLVDEDGLQLSELL